MPISKVRMPNLTRLELEAMDLWGLLSKTCRSLRGLRPGMIVLDSRYGEYLASGCSGSANPKPSNLELERIHTEMLSDDESHADLRLPY